MKKLICILLILLMLASCTMPNLKKYEVVEAAESDAPDYELLRNSDYLAFLEKLSAFSSEITEGVFSTVGINQNFCISPMSVYMALALVVEASSGETRQEILDALGLSYDEVSTFTKELYAFRNRKYAYKNSYGNDVVSAYEMLSNSIWLDEGLAYNQTGVNNLVSNYY